MPSIDPLGYFCFFINYSIVNAFGTDIGYGVQFFLIMTMFAVLHRVLTEMWVFFEYCKSINIVGNAVSTQCVGLFQLSSLPMMFAVLFWLMSILALISHPKKLFGSHLLSSIFFVASVLSYEQILPLLIVNLVVAVTRFEDFKVRVNSYSSFYSLSISAFCALFLFFYFGNQNNPKVVTVKFENSMIEQQLSQDSHTRSTPRHL